MGNSKTVSKTGLFILLVALSFDQGCPAATAKLFPNGAQAWTKIPTVVVSGKQGDPRTQLVIDAVDFWNQQLSEIGSAFRLGPVTFTNEIIPDEELERRSNAVLNGQAFEPPSLMKIHGDLIVALSDWEIVSFAGPALRDGRRLVIRGYQYWPLTVPNVARNVIGTSWAMQSGLATTTILRISCVADPPRAGRLRFGPKLKSTSPLLRKKNKPC